MYTHWYTLFSMRPPCKLPGTVRAVLLGSVEAQPCHCNCTCIAALLCSCVLARHFGLTARCTSKLRPGRWKHVSHRGMINTYKTEFELQAP